MATELDNRTRTTVGDVGLLILRIGVGATMLQAGLKKFFDFNNTADFLALGGWKASKFAAFMVATAETAGGALLILGLLTPLAACAVLAAMIDAWAVNVTAAAFWSDPFNLPFMLALGAVTLLFTGAGGLSLDARLFGRPRWPAAIAVGLLVLAIVAAIVTWIVLNGTNPINFGRPQG